MQNRYQNNVFMLCLNILLLTDCIKSKSVQNRYRTSFLSNNIAIVTFSIATKIILSQCNRFSTPTLCAQHTKYIFQARSLFTSSFCRYFISNRTSLRRYRQIPEQQEFDDLPIHRQRRSPHSHKPPVHCLRRFWQ